MRAGARLSTTGVVSIAKDRSYLFVCCTVNTILLNMSV